MTHSVIFATANCCAAEGVFDHVVGAAEQCRCHPETQCRRRVNWQASSPDKQALQTGLLRHPALSAGGSG